MHNMTLRDDGTLDTVVACPCGQTYRYDYAADEMGESYDDFVAWALEDARQQHAEAVE